MQFVEIKQQDVLCKFIYKCKLTVVLRTIEAFVGIIRFLRVKNNFGGVEK